MKTPLDYQDFTVKAIITDAVKIEDLLDKNGAEFMGTDHQTDTYFEVSIGKLKLREGTLGNLITHCDRVSDDGLERTTVYQYDVNPSAEQIDELRRSSKTLGITEKERKIYLLDNVKIHLDKTSDGKMFLEIEAIDQDNSMSPKVLQFQCIHMLAWLGSTKDHLVPTGYFQHPQ